MNRPNFLSPLPSLPPTSVITTNLINTSINNSTSPSPIGPPKPKDTPFVHTAAVRALRGNYHHYLGQKGFPMFANLPYYSYEGMMSMPDWMHGCKVLHEWIMKIIVGPLGDNKASALQYRSKADTKARRQLKQRNIFPDLWEDAPQYLSTRKANLLRSMDPDVIVHENTSWCKRWWKACGKKVEEGTRVAALRTQILEWREYLLTNPQEKLVISRGNHLRPN